MKASLLPSLTLRAASQENLSEGKLYCFFIALKVFLCTSPYDRVDEDFYAETCKSHCGNFKCANPQKSLFSLNDTTTIVSSIFICFNGLLCFAVRAFHFKKARRRKTNRGKEQHPNKPISLVHEYFIRNDIKNCFHFYSPSILLIVVHLLKLAQLGASAEQSTYGRNRKTMPC